MPPMLPAAVVERAIRLFTTGFVVLDFETTGLSHTPGVAIVEIGLINHFGEVIYHTLVKPDCYIPPEVTRIHGINDDDVADAPEFPDVYPHLNALLEARHVVTYNAEFEKSILKVVCKRFGVELIKPAEWHCAMRMYAALRGLRGWMKLERACRQESIPTPISHRALADCQSTLALVQKMAREFE